MTSTAPAASGVSLQGRLDSRLRYDDIANPGRFSDDFKELLQQSRGSARSQDSFHPVGLKLLTRVFGEDCTGLDLHTGTAGWVRESARGSHGTGGWLKRLNTRSGQSSVASSRLCHGWRSLDPGTANLLSHFLPHSQYMDVMTNNGCVDVKMRLDRFPVKGQICIRQSSYYECVSSPNQIVYFPPYFKTASNEQFQPLLRSDTDPVMMLKFHEFFFICLLRYPKEYSSAFSAAGMRSDVAGVVTRSSAHPCASLGATPGSIFGKLHSMLQSSPLGLLNSKGVYGIVDGSPFMVLLNESLKEYVPHARSSSSSSGGSSSKGGVGASGGGSASRNARGTASHLSPDVNLAIAGELFIRLMAEYWMDSATVVRRNHSQGANFKAQLNKTMVHYNTADLTGRHPLPTDILTLDNNSMTWGSATMQCVYVVLVRMLSDPYLADQFSTLAQANGASFESAHIMASYAKASGYSRSSSQSAHQSSIVCPPALGLVQQPMFDMLRTVFSKADVGSGAEWEMHAMAVECWLLYIQPWKAEAIDNGAPLEKVNQTGTYDRDIWLPYIAANLHFYTTIFAIFFQSVCKTDLSVVENPGLVHLLLLEKVLLAFSPLMDDVNKLVEDFKAWYPEHSRDTALSKTMQQHTNSNFSISTPNSAKQSPANGSHSHGRGVSQFFGGGGTSLQTLVAIRAQHHWLFPDASIDKLADFGIVETRRYTKPQAQKIISMLTVAMRDCNPKKLFNLLEVAAGTVDMLIAVEHWGQGLSFTRLLGILGVSFDNKGDNSLIDRITADIEKIRYVTECGTLSSEEALLATQDIMTDSASSNSEHDGTSKDITDESTGKLKSRGRRILQTGGRVPIDALRWFGDVLEMPYCSYEVQFLVSHLVDLSYSLNELYNLPQKCEAGQWTWKRIAIHLHEYIEADVLPVKAKYVELKRLMRFNLRVFAHVRVISAVALFLATRSFMFSFIGLWNYFIVGHFFLLFYGNTTDLPSVYYSMQALAFAFYMLYYLVFRVIF